MAPILSNGNIDFSEKMHGCEALSGALWVVSGSRNRPDQRVQAKIYRSQFDHFAVIQPDKKICNNSMFLNLKNCSVEKLDNEEFTFQIRQLDCEGYSITLRTESVKELEAWLDALRLKANGVNNRLNMNCNHCLPIVEEGDEE